MGDTGAWKDFTLSVSHCPSTLALATAFFYGQADSTHPTKFANIGSAKGLALELADRQTIYSLPRRQPLTFRLTQRTTRQRFLWLPAIMPAHCPSPPERLTVWSSDLYLPVGPRPFVRTLLRRPAAGFAGRFLTSGTSGCSIGKTGRALSNRWP